MATLGVLGFAARGALRPTLAVEILPAMVRTGVQSAGTAVVQAPGWVEPDPYFTAVTTLTDGVVEELAVLEGDHVVKGQVVARLVPDDARLALRRAEAELAEHEAYLQSALAAAREAERNWEHPIELRRKLATNEAMLAEKQAELARWPAEVEAQKATVAELLDAYDRARRARAESEGALSEQELVRAQQQYESQKAVLVSIESRKPIIEAQIRNLEAEVQAARESLDLRIADTRALDEARAGVAQVEALIESARVARDEARLRLDRTEIRSPVDGIVSMRLVQPGSKVMLNADYMDSAQIVRLYDPQRLQVRVDVPLSEAAHVRVGQAAEVVVGTLPHRSFSGKVTRIVHEADIQKNTLQFKVAIQEPAPEIKPEMLARVKFLAAATTQPTETAVLFVPARLIQNRTTSGSPASEATDESAAGSGGAVWLFDQTKKIAELRPVVTGNARMGDWIEVRQGLRQGDWLIANPPADLRPGTPLRVTGEAQGDRENGSPRDSGTIVNRHGGHS